MTMEYAAIPGRSPRVPRLLMGSAALGTMDDAAVFEPDCCQGCCHFGWLLAPIGTGRELSKE